MGNKISSQSNSRIVDSKLAVILEEINQKLKDAPIDEKEELLISFNNIISKFYKTLTSPILSIDPFRSGLVPNYKDLNKKFLEVSQDLDVIYREINSLHSFIVENYNTLNSLSSSVRARIRKIASDLGDYKLYATDNLGGALYFSDTFKNTDKTDYTDSLYKQPKCFVDIFSGAASLPLDEGKTKQHTVDSISVGTTSNGVAGNNQELGSLRRDRLDSIVDNAADTWYEYESVNRTQTNQPLILELRIKLDAESIVNTLDISTVAFGSKKHPKITRLEVSSDGTSFTSILDQIVSNASVDGKNVLNLNPTADNMSESNKIYFPPKKITYINIIFQQNESYVIRTSSGSAFRKAVGIRGISVIGQAYKAKGEIVSIPFNANGEIKKIALKNNVTDAFGITNVTHFISHNNGQNWFPIQSVQELSSTSPEILNFNLEGVQSNKTELPVASIRHKAVLERNVQGFSARGGTITSKLDASEFVNLSASTQSVTVKNKPLAGTVNIFNVSYGSVGGSNTYYISRSEIIERTNRSFVYLPHEPFARNTIGKDQEIIRIKNQIWKRVDSLASESSTKTYEFDYLNNVIKFGDGINGSKPDGDIEFSLKRERVLVQNDTKKLVFPRYKSDQVVASTKLYRLGKEETKTNVTLRKSGSIHSLGFPEVVSITVTTDAGSLLATEKDFIDGAEELSASGHYSIDYQTGTLYTYDLSPSNADVIVSVTYRTKTPVSSLTYDAGAVVIPDADYIVEKMSINLTIAMSTHVVTLPHQSIQPRSLKILSLNNLLSTEVPFKGDGTEFNLPLSAGELAGYYTVDYLNGVIYSYSALAGTLYLDYNKSDYYLEYNIAVEIPKEEYIVDTNNSTITFSDKYIIKTFSNSLLKLSGRTLFKAAYKYAQQIEQNPRELEPFYTPLLQDYRLAVLTKEKL